jgi:sortase (surface protein transpeptidase)
VAVIVNITAVDTSGGGFISAYPLGKPWPGTSSLNHDRWETRGSAAMVKLGQASGTNGFNLYTLNSTHIVVDVAGYITGESGDNPSGDGLFVPITPVRLGDTRYLSRRIWPGGTATFKLPSPMNTRASAVAMNLAVTSTIGGGYFTAYAAQTARQVVSSLNVVRARQTVANHAFSKVSAAGISCFSQSGAHIIADVTGWFTGKQEPITTAPPFNPPPPGGPIPWIVSIPRLGLHQWVFDGDANWIVDSGNTWHWTGTGLVGSGAHVVLFGHRTEHGGPYRYQHNLRAGDMLHVNTSDGRRYNYRLVAEYLSSSAPRDFLAKTRLVGGETVSIVACTKLNRLPTDTRYRLISTVALVGWDDLG